MLPCTQDCLHVGFPTNLNLTHILTLTLMLTLTLHPYCLKTPERTLPCIQSKVYQNTLRALQGSRRSRTTWSQGDRKLFIVMPRSFTVNTGRSLFSMKDVGKLSINIPKIQGEEQHFLTEIDNCQYIWNHKRNLAMLCV